MQVTDVVTGHYMKEGDQLQITLEAMDVADNRTLWRDTMTVAAPDMIAMRSQITAKVRQGSGSRSRRGNAIQQRLPHIPRTKRPTISTCAASRCRMIRCRTKMPSPCWSARWDLTPPTLPPGMLSGIATSYDSSLFRTAARHMYQRSNAAFERALALDPNFVAPRRAGLIRMQVERGELVKAYRTRRRCWSGIPKMAAAHFAMAYVLRYGGALEESAHECDTALSLDRGKLSVPLVRRSLSTNWETTRERWIFSSWMPGRYGPRQPDAARHSRRKIGASARAGAKIKQPVDDCLPGRTLIGERGKPRPCSRGHNVGRS